MKFAPETIKLIKRVVETNLPAACYGFLRYGVGDLVRLEASSICQLRCPACIQNTRELGVVGFGTLRFENFRRFVDRYPHFKRIELSNYGEIFLNPELEDIIGYAHQKRIRLTAHNGVNFNKVSPSQLEGLVKYRFRSLTISIDGASQETYGIYRQGGDFETVLENIRRLNRTKELHQSVYPKLRWQFIVFGHNEHELPAARQLAQNLQMQFYPRLNYQNDYSPIRNPDFVRAATGLKVVSVSEYQQKYETFYHRYCEQLWLAPQINWDGQLLGCCVNRWGSFGNVFTDGLEACLQSDKYCYAKKMLLGLSPHRDDIPCTQCRRYQVMQKNKRYLLSFLNPNP